VRLCVVNPFGYKLFDPDAAASQVFGGAEVQLYYLSTMLAGEPDLDVSMIVERPGDRTVRSREGVTMFGVEPMSPRFARLRDRIPLPAPSYWSAMRRADADIYLQRGGAVLTGDVGGFCRATGRRFVFMAAHDWDCDRSHLRGAQYLAGASYAVGLRGADLVISQSSYQRDLLRRHHGIDSVVQRTVYPASDLPELERRHVLWVGRCLDWKRPMAFLDLAVTRPNTEFVMVCPAFESALDLHERVEKRAATLPNVRFLGFVPFAATEELFRRAIAFVNTSTAEGFPNTFVQAARTGTPVLSLSVDPDGMLGDADIGACADGDTRVLAERLAEALDAPETWRRWSANAVRYFQREHDLTSKGRALAQTLRALATSGPDGRPRTRNRRTRNRRSRPRARD
jgi:glycosyltransferase involved in cell wall biosynthesis